MSQEVSKDTVYREMYTEMRRFRDYQFTSSMWYTLQLIAIEAGLISSKYDNKWCDLEKALSNCCCLKLLVALVAIVIATIASFLIWYSHSRYEAIRAATDKYLEPSWKGSTEDLRDTKRQLVCEQKSSNFNQLMKCTLETSKWQILGCRGRLQPHWVYIGTVWTLFATILVTIFCY